MLRALLRASLFSVSAFIFFSIGTFTVQAGNTVSVNAGDQMPNIEITLNNAISCTPDTDYLDDTPDSGLDVRSRWMAAKNGGPGLIVFNFGGAIVNNGAGRYDFTCGVPGDTDSATLVVCNNVTNQKDGAGGCMAKAPAAPAAPTVSPGLCESGEMNISWPAITAATSYSLRDGATPIYTGNGTAFRHVVANDSARHSYTLSVTTEGGTSGYSITNEQNAPGACARPDLVAQVLSVSPGTVIRGQTTMTVTARIDNVGGANAPGFTMSDLYLDTDNDGWSNVNGVGILPAVAGITAGSNQTITGTWIIPANTPLTNIARVGFHADVNNVVAEGGGDSSTANWSGWSGSFTINDPIPADPASAPAATALACDSGQIRVTWDPVPGATKYSVRMSGTDLPEVAGTQYIVSGLFTNTDYTFSVRAGNNTGWSNYSPTVTATAPSICAPAVPNPFNAATAMQCGGQINLSWSPSAGAPTHYEISSNGGTNWTNVGNVNAALLQSLTPGATYNNLQVRAVNGSGPSVAATASAVASAACTIPVIDGLSHRNIGQTTTDVAATITSDGGQSVLDRGFCWGTASSPSNCYTEGAVGTGVYNLSLTGLNTGTTIYYRAYARNSVGTAYSPDNTFLTVTATPNNPTSGLPAQPCSSQIIDLTWAAVTGGSQYELFRNGNSIYLGASSGYSDTGLAHGQSYDYSVRAFNANGIPSPQSTVAAISAPAECIYPDLRPAAPTLSITTVRYGATINFTAVIQNAGLAEAGPYNNSEFYIDYTNDPWDDVAAFIPVSAVVVNTPAGGSQTVTGSWTVPEGTPLSTQYRVGFHADVPGAPDVFEGPSPVWDNWSTWSGYFSVVEPEPATPTRFVANVAPVMPPTCGGRVNLAWDHMTYADYYEVSVNGAAWINVGYVNRFSLNTSHGLSAGNDATIRVRAVNTTGPSAPDSLVVRASNMCTDLFGATCDISLNQNSCNTATATWDLTGGLPAFLVENKSNGNAFIGNTVIGDRVPLIMKYGVNTIKAYSDNGIERATWAPTIVCGPNLFFHPVQNVCKTIPTIILSPIPTTGIIRSGNTASIRTRVTADYDLTCTFSNNLVPGGQINHRGGINTDETRATVPLTAGQIIQVNCRVPGNANPVFTGDTRIEVVTEYSET